MAPHGYNLTKCKDGRIAGWKASKETREKMKQGTILQHANRDRLGCVSFNKRQNKYYVRGPPPNKKSIGYYFTEEKAIKALNHFNASGKCMESDRIRRKYGTGSVRKSKNGKRYEAMHTKNKKKKIQNI